MNLQLHMLEEGELEVTGRLVDASNATLLARCHYDKKEFDVIYKPVAGERPLWDFPHGNLAQREVAAFHISEIGKFSVVPPTVLRDGPFGLGMVQRWIDTDPEIDLAQFYREDNPALRNIALFDAIINNTDRKIGHLLPVSREVVYGCDHGVTFHEDDKLRTVLWQWADQPFNESELLRIHDLQRALSFDGSLFQSLITENEFNSLIRRIDLLLEKATFPLPSTEWPPIPWPPF
jgi:uncharacterized repeat protein (TIGR03843 family)